MDFFRKIFLNKFNISLWTVLVIRTDQNPKCFFFVSQFQKKFLEKTLPFMVKTYTVKYFLVAQYLYVALR